MNQQPSQPLKGRGASIRPPNRFEAVHQEADWEQLDEADAQAEAERRVDTEFLPDRTQSIITRNDSPDIPFNYSINPYRGCEHGCSYCYARPYHEFLGMNAGVDFESRILVKHDAPQLLRVALNRPSWEGEIIAISGVTDCYQPAERRFHITRGLLEVMLEARQCLGIITKNALVTRDLDLLAPLAERRLVQVNISLTTLDADLAGSMEPRTSTPAARLAAIRKLTAAGVPVRVMVAPIIPGLNDHHVAGVLEAVAEAGAVGAGFTLLRLPLAVKPIFLDWLARHWPEKLDRVEALIRGTRGGELSDPRFKSRMRGEGEYAEQIAKSFRVFAKRFGLEGRLPELDTLQFQPPHLVGGQMRLF